jgi:hypothetical protein
LSEYTKVPQSEGNAVWPRTGAEPGRTEDFTASNVALGIDAQSRDAAAGGFDHVEIFFRRVEPDLVGEPKAVRDDVDGAVLVAGQIAVGQISSERVHPVLDSRGDRDPDAVA